MNSLSGRFSIILLDTGYLDTNIHDLMKDIKDSLQSMVWIKISFNSLFKGGRHTNYISGALLLTWFNFDPTMDE